jgi:DNA repair photolyase
MQLGGSSRSSTSSLGGSATAGTGSRVLDLATEVWNPITGCLHSCIYCWARRLVLTKLRIFPRYRDGFTPKLNEGELRRSFKPNTLVPCYDMSDIFSPGVRDEWVCKVLEHIAKHPKTLFLLLTKNPERYKDFLSAMPRNVILGATIETDNDELYLQHKVSQAPLPSRRIKAMKHLPWGLKLVAVEPILDFTDRFDREIAEIKPVIVYIGYDNYGNRLPEPLLQKTVSLVRFLEARGIEVKTKILRPAWYEASLNRV